MVLEKIVLHTIIFFSPTMFLRVCPIEYFLGCIWVVFEYSTIFNILGNCKLVQLMYQSAGRSPSQAAGKQNKHAVFHPSPFQHQVEVIPQQRYKKRTA